MGSHNVSIVLMHDAGACSPAHRRARLAVSAGRRARREALEQALFASWRRRPARRRCSCWPDRALRCPAAGTAVRPPLCIGQKQRWFLLRLKSPRWRSNSGAPRSRTQWRWASYWEPVKEVIYFKRPVYARALTDLATLASRAGGPPPLPEWWDKLTAHRGRAAPVTAE